MASWRRQEKAELTAQVDSNCHSASRDLAIAANISNHGQAPQGEWVTRWQHTGVA
jgi:hypothetical protein